MTKKNPKTRTRSTPSALEEFARVTAPHKRPSWFDAHPDALEQIKKFCKMKLEGSPLSWNQFAAWLHEHYDYPYGGYNVNQYVRRMGWLNG